MLFLIFRASKSLVFCLSLVCGVLYEYSCTAVWSETIANHVLPRVAVAGESSPWHVCRDLDKIYVIVSCPHNTLPVLFDADLTFLVDKGRPEDRAASQRSYEWWELARRLTVGRRGAGRGGEVRSVQYMLLNEDAAHAVCSIYCQSGKKFDGGVARQRMRLIKKSQP